MKQFSVSRVIIKIQRGCSVGGLTLLSEKIPRRRNPLLMVHDRIKTLAACLTVAQPRLISTLVLDMPIRRCRNSR